MTDENLPPYLRESNQQQRPPELRLPLEDVLPEILQVPPMPAPEEKEERPVDPFLRRG